MDHSYAAGLIDGEGHIAISVNRVALPQMSVGMAEKAKPILDELARMYGGKVRKFRDETDVWAEVWTWSLSSTGEIVACLEKMLPYLILKREQALLVLELEEMRAALPRRANGSAQWDAASRRRGEIIYKRMRELNKRGPRPKEAAQPTDMRPVAICKWGAMWEPDESLFGPVEFEGAFPMWGKMIDGHVYAVEPPARPTSVPLLPTPHANAATGAGTQGRDGGPNLQTVAATLTD